MCIRDRPAQVLANVNWIRQPLPEGLWHALKARGLVHADAPVPATGSEALA